MISLLWKDVIILFAKFVGNQTLSLNLTTVQLTRLNALIIVVKKNVVNLCVKIYYQKKFMQSIRDSRMHLKLIQIKT
jgi:hypothetical protein